MDEDIMLNIVSGSKNVTSVKSSNGEDKKMSKTDIKRMKYSEKMKRNVNKSKKSKNGLASNQK